MVIEKEIMFKQYNLLDLFPKKILLLITITVISFHCIAQQYNVTHYTEADGLGNTTTHAIAQDSTGKMWFATRAGVTSYDGSTWKNYNTNDGLARRGYAFIEVDEKGHIWALSYEGTLSLTLFNGDGWERFSPVNNTKELGKYRALSVHYINEEPVVVVATKENGILVNRQQSWTHYTVSNGLLSDIITAICFVNDTLFVATNRGINTLYNGEVTIFDGLSLGFPDTNIVGMYSQKIPDADTVRYILWVAGKDWMGYISDQKFTLVSSSIQVTISEVFNHIFLVPDQQDGIYYGNEFSIQYFDFATKKSSRLGQMNGLIAEGAISVFIDRERNAWIAGGRGLNKIPSKRFANFNKENGLFDNEVTSIEEISPGNYVFGHIGALTFYEDGVFDEIELPYSSGNWHEKRVMDISIDKDRNIWFAAGLLGIGFIDKNKQIKFFRAKEGFTGFATSVISTSSGKVYACSPKGFFVLSGNTFKQVNFEGSWDLAIRKIFEAKDGSLYCTSYENGIYKITNGEAVNINYDGPEDFNNTFSFWESPTGEILIGSARGLLIVEDSILVKYKAISLERPIYLIMNDRKGNIWLGSDNGIYMWDGTKLEHFSVDDGIAGQEINRDGGLLDANNNLWFGTNNGVTRYREEYDHNRDPDIPPPIISLSFVEVEGDSLSLLEEITLDYNSNDLTFNFKGISFINEDKVYYQCKLEGFDKEWTPEFRSLQNSYRYFNLAAGGYRFCIKARNALGVWSDPICSNLIIIQSPIWFRWWFITLSIVIIVLVVSAISRNIARKKYTLKLEEIVQDRTKELSESNRGLIKAKERAEESDRLKSAFLANMSHEIRTPMNGILGFAELLKEPDLTGEEQQKYIQVIENSGARMLNIINDIINISKIEAGLEEVHWQESNITEQAEYIYTFFKPEIEILGIQFSYNNPMPSKEIILKTDREKVYAILTNLVKNAIKYTKKGAIEFGYTKKGKFLEFYVQDTGIGIPKERQAAIFKRFVQADISDVNAYQGAGLGLSISKAYVEILGGKIWVESEVGKGSTFYFTLPYTTQTKKAESTAIEVLPTVEANPIDKIKILLVEDDKSSEELISVVVQKFGKEVLIATTGAEAVETCLKNLDIDLVLMDIKLPEMNGYEAVREIRKFNKEVIIIAQTAYAMKGDKEKAIAAGCDDYMPKPINAEELKQKISKYFKK